MNDDMSCRELAEFLMDYLEGGLPDDQRAHFEKHLALCPPCVDYLDSYRTTVEIGKKALRDQDPPCDIPEALVRAILEATRRKS